MEHTEAEANDNIQIILVECEGSFSLSYIVSENHSKLQPSTHSYCSHLVQEPDRTNNHGDDFTSDEPQPKSLSGRCVKGNWQICLEKSTKYQRAAC